MRALVTGAGGFIGSHLTEMLLNDGFEVRALARYNGRSDPGNLKYINRKAAGNLEIILGDVTDPFFIRDLVAQCDIVFHLAALIGIPYSYVAPASYIATNIGGTVNVLEACRRASVKRVIVTSTSEVYGTAKYTPIDESHPLQGQSPYSASKIAADKLCESYFRSFDLPVVTLRPFNTYGPRQSARAFIPTVLTQALRGSKKIELGNVATQRDLTFVLDTAAAFLLAARAEGIEGDTIHFGQGAAHSMEEIAKLCLKVVGSDAEIISVINRMRPEKSEVELLLCDASYAKARIGWGPNISLEEGVARTAQFIEKNLMDYSSHGYSI
ncbi:MAG: SDR family NAD(P)-dependent oxidoreductase [Pseudolabrys sp.]|nr:SDR family NAD(P)-dependent oxidoreductase [Pseudolabrys sp.]